MKQEQFEIIENNLRKRVSQCEEKLDHILCTEDLYNITIKEFMELQSFCRQEQIDMTEILMVDLYHVLGMGKLTMTQRNTFLSLLNKYATYRSDIKCICNMNEISDLGKLPARSKFKLHKLGDVTFESDPRGSTRALTVLEETNEISDYREAKKDDRALAAATETYQYKSIIISGDTITFDVKDAKEFITTIASSASLENLLKHCNNHTNYCDIVWKYTNDACTQISGRFLSEGARVSHLRKIKARAQ